MHQVGLDPKQSIEPIGQQEIIEKNTWSMTMPMVYIWHMGVSVLYRFMLVPVTVLACRHRLMHVVMMRIVMSVGVNVFQHFVGVLMGMCFQQVQQNTQQHQYPGDDHQSTDRTVSHSKGPNGTDERGKCKNGARACRAEGALCQQIKPQAQAVTGRTNGHQAENVHDQGGRLIKNGG